MKLVGLLLAASTILAGLAPAFADVFAYKDGNGVLTFTNVPNHNGYKRVLREGNAPGSVGSGGSTAYEFVPFNFVRQAWTGSGARRE